ncbi:MAG TPA: GNAT family N-acetyltransferase [Candidatus Acidoferrales bacterium]|nr:GNAT family N-acetyltransferase [Candidatus Acidoferrales bacterium]
MSLKTTLSRAGKVGKPSTPQSKNAGVRTLSPEQFEQWDALVSLSPHGTVFHYSWWLQATGSDFKILGYWDEHGNLVGGIPLPYKKRAGLMLYHSPQLTPYLGPVFDLTAVDKTPNALLIMREVGEQLAQAIRGYDSLIYTAGATAPDLQGFLWAGFHADLGYTFRIEAGTTVDRAFQQISRTHRQKLNKGAEYLIETAADVSVLSKLSNHTFERQGIARPYNEHYLQRLWEEASRRNRGVIYTARDVYGAYAAALFIVYDYRSSYQIVSGVDMTVPNSPAGGLLTWRGICDALNAGRTFDFEGSSIRGVEQYYRRWGGQAHPVWHLKKTGSLSGSLAKLFLKLRDGAGKDKNPE